MGVPTDFEGFLKLHPDASYADFYVARLREVISSEGSHRSLGRNLRDATGEVPFLEAGRNEFLNYLKWFGIEPNHRIVDYGCGSLRIGIHFLSYLEKGNYFGLDVTRDFIDLGLERVSEHLGSDHGAHIGLIGTDMERARSFRPDFVISSNVAYHVHPDETALYFDNLRSLLAKGSSVIFDGRVAANHGNFDDRHWAWPLAFYQRHFADHAEVRIIPAPEQIASRTAQGEIVRTVFAYRRDAL